MSKLRSAAARQIFAALFVCGVLAAAAVPADLSKYRTFQFGSSLPTIARQLGVNVTQAKPIHTRPALIQELAWRPQSLGLSPQRESANEVVFSFYNGELYRIAVKYDRYEIEGLTAEDVTEAVSTLYGPADKLVIPARPAEERYGDQDEGVASWQDSQYSFDLVRSSYGPIFKLIGVMKRLDTLAQSATLEAKRLDLQEAPQREAARQAGEQETAKAKLEKSRLVNKPLFRP